MPNFKIIQDMPDQARVKIYGTNDVALNTDISGNLAITTLGNSLAITTLGNAMSITTSGNALAITTLGNAMSITTSGNALAITTLDNALAITTLGNAMSITTSGNALAITTLGNAMSITTSGNALAITTLSNPLAITTASPISVTQSLATTDVTYTSGDFTATGLISASQDVLSVARWSWIAYNTCSDATAIAAVKMQGSPNGTNWIDNSGLVTLSQYGVTALVPSFFLKYSRVYYSAGATAASLNIYFQGQS